MLNGIFQIERVLFEQILFVQLDLIGFGFALSGFGFVLLGRRFPIVVDLGKN